MVTNELSTRELEAEMLVELPERQLMTGLSLGANLAICIDLDVSIGVGGGSADCGGSGGGNPGGGYPGGGDPSPCGGNGWGR